MSDTIATVAAPLDEHILANLDYWQNFGGTDRQKLRMLKADRQWLEVIRGELSMGCISLNGREIRLRIGQLEPCHEHYVDNIRDILAMIGRGQPSGLVECGVVCDSRSKLVAAYARALRAYLDNPRPPERCNPLTDQMFHLLGDCSPAKRRLLEQLLAKLLDDSHTLYRARDEDFATIESRIQHLSVCNFNWERNLLILLKEIAAGRRLFDWHATGGFNSHGDVPDRLRELADILKLAGAWMGGNEEAGGWVGRLLGRLAQEKRYLVASLCKTIAAQHERLQEAGSGPLPRLDYSLVGEPVERRRSQATRTAS